MCGILTYINAPSQRIPALVASGLHEQHNRGVDGAGYILVPQWRADAPVVRRFLSPFHAMVQLQKDIDEFCDMEGLTTIAFHHRLPTSTANIEHCNHPIESGGSFLIHNGIIYNSHELKKKHEREGYAYATLHANKFNDSEALAHEWTQALTNPKKRKTGYHYKLRAQGSFAFVRYNPSTRVLQYGRNSMNPLNFAALGDNTIALCSQTDTEIAEHKNWFQLPDGVLYSLNVETLQHDVATFTHAHYQPPTYSRPAASSFSGLPYSSAWDDDAAWSAYDKKHGITSRADESKTLQSGMFDDDDTYYIPAKYRITSQAAAPSSSATPKKKAKKTKTDLKREGWLHIPKK